MLAVLLLFPTVSFAAKAVDWNIVKTTTEAQSFYYPSSGVFHDIGAKMLYLTLTTNSTQHAYSILFYQSNGTKLISTETVVSGAAKTLLTPYYKLLAICGSEEIGLSRATAEVYILN